MKFTLKDSAAKKTLVFPITPNKLTIKNGTKTISFDQVSSGERQIPRGTEPLNITFGGLLPLGKMEVETVNSKSAKSVIKQIQNWQKKDRKKLKLIITGTPYNLNVFIDEFKVDYEKNNIYYSITLKEYKNMTISVTKNKKKKKPKPAKKRSTNPKKKTKWYTVKRGDNLWNISKRYTGRGIRWKEMWAINKKRSRSKNPHLIYPKERFQIPTKW